MIKQAKSYEANGHIAIIIGKEYSPVDGVSTIVAEQAQKLIASSEDSDYLKIGEQFIFLVKENENLEKLRVAGHSIRTKLAKSAKNIFIAGEGQQALTLAEGIELSN